MQLRVPTYTLKLIGCDSLFLTTAVGSLRENVGPGSLVCLEDHINLQVISYPIYVSLSLADVLVAVVVVP